MSRASDRTWKALDRRIRELERNAVRLRKGMMTSEGIDLGDSGVAHADVAAIGHAAEGSTVAVLARGHGLLSLGQIGAGALSGSLPTSPSNGELALYRPSTGVIWHCVYDAAQHTADGNGWVVIGGPPIVGDYTDANGHTTSSTSYTSLPGGPSISLPRAGVWDVSVGCAAHSGDDNQAGYMSYAIGGTLASDDDSVRISYGGGNSGQPDGGSVWTTRRKELSAVTLATRYRVSGGTTRFYRRRILAMPVRFAS